MNIQGETLTLANAREILATAEAEAVRSGVAVAIAILDAGGYLLDFSRMDGAHRGTIDVAIAKARCAAVFGRPTKNFADAYAGGRTALVALPSVVPFDGGTPIMRDGHLVGAIGVSGAPEEVDGQIAVAGASNSE